MRRRNRPRLPSVKGRCSPSGVYHRKKYQRGRCIWNIYHIVAYTQDKKSDMVVFGSSVDKTFSTADASFPDADIIDVFQVTTRHS